MKTGLIIALVVLIVVLIVILATCVKIVRQSTIVIVERIGKYHKTLESGLHFIAPFIDRTLKPISLKEKVADFRPQAVITKDNVTMQIDTVVYFQVTDPKLFTYGVESPLMAIENLTATTLRNLVGELELDGTLTSRDTVNAKMRIILDEATGKKCMFLSEVVKELNLTSVTVINNRAEELAKDIKYRENFDICTARAVARLNTLSEYCMPFVKPGGSFIAFKADAEEEIKEAMNAVKILGGKLKGTVSFDLFGNKRTVVVINKVQKTPEKYPRGNGKERKKPL